MRECQWLTILSRSIVLSVLQEDAELLQETLAREVTRRVQQLRKEAGCVPTDDVEVFYESEGGAQSEVTQAIAAQGAFVRTTLGRDLHPAALLPSHAIRLAKGSLELEGSPTLNLT